MPPSANPRTFGRYEVLRSLGRGAVGEVFLARDPALGRLVAVKTLSGLDALPPAERAEARARFLREARAAASLSHPHIVTIHDVGEADGVPFLAMEHLEGTTLDRHVQQTNLLPAVKVVELGIHAALALEEAHRRGIVHRDVKPANLALLADGSLKVVDFGLAKGPDTHLTAAETLLGTPNYMSPEQIAGRTLDGRSDLFSLAVALFELLTGQRPFGGDTVSSVLYRIVNDPPLSLARLRPDLPIDLDQLLTQALAKDPQKRTPSCAVLAAELSRILEQMGGVPPDLRLPAPAERTLATRAPAGEDRGRAKARSKWVGIGVAAVVLAAVGLGLFFTTTGEKVIFRLRNRIVSVETDPPGLAVRVVGGGRAQFLSPGQLSVPRALTVPVVLEAGDECRTATSTLDPSAPPTRVRLVAAPRIVRIPAGTRPPGAELSADGAPLPGATPVEVPLTLCEPHTVEFRAAGRAPVTVQLGAGESAAVWRGKLAAIPLPPAGGPTEAPAAGQVIVPAPPGYPAVVRTADSDRRVGVAGRYLTLSAGVHELLLLNPEVLLRLPIKVKVPAGGSVKAVVTWPRLGTLTVRATPPGGRVLAKSGAGDAPVELGVTPLNRMPVVAGDYELIIEHPFDGRRVVRPIAVHGDVDSPPIRVGQEDWR